MRESKKDNKLEYWEYFLLNIDECIGINPKDRWEEIRCNEIHPPRVQIKRKIDCTT